MYQALAIAAVFFFLLWGKKENRIWGAYGAILLVGMLALPMSLLFQNFYGKEVIQFIFPSCLWIASAGTILLTEDKLTGVRKKILPVIIIVLIFLCGNLTFDNIRFDMSFSAKEDKEILRIMEVLEEEWGRDPYVNVVAVDEVMKSVRAYSGDFYVVYGRDLWEPELLPYFYDGYEEWQYLLHEKMNSNLFDVVEGLEKNAKDHQMQLLELIQNSGATHVVLKKTNVIPKLLLTEEREKEVEILTYNGMTLRQIENTSQYFVYRVER